MINSVQSIPCDICGGNGYIFYGDENDYGVEGCACVDNPVNLFTTPENN